MSSLKYTCNLSEQVQEYAKDVLHETEATRRFGLDELKKWAGENPHSHVRTQEKYLIPFSRVSKYDSEKAKQKLTNFYTMRRDRIEWFANRDPTLPQIQDLIKMGSFSVAKKTFENQLLVIIRPTFYDPKTYHLDDVVKCGLMVLDVAVMEEELAQIYGVVGVIDMTNVGSGHLRQSSPNRIKNIVNSWQNFHCRPQRIEFINAPSYINVVSDIFKSFMTTKLKQRTHVCYDGFSSVAKLIDKEILPEEYGGSGGTSEELGSYWNDKLIAYSDWFKEDADYKAESEKSKGKSWFSRNPSNS